MIEFMSSSLCPTESTSVFLEITREDKKHGGTGWEFGKCLWSPICNAVGSKYYEVMKKPHVGDLVFHNYRYKPQGLKTDFYLCAYSYVKTACVTRSDPPPEPGAWDVSRGVYRIELQGFTWLQAPILMSDFEDAYHSELATCVSTVKERFFPFTIERGELRITQGMYLAKVPPFLFKLICGYIDLAETQTDREVIKEAHESFAEGARRSKEKFFFSRNPALAKAAKEKADYTCAICGFNPAQKWGKRYRGVAIECHHKKLVSTGDGIVHETSLDDVAVLCSNCHSLVHSRKGTPYTVEEASRIVAARV